MFTFSRKSMQIISVQHLSCYATKNKFLSCTLVKFTLLLTKQCCKLRVIFNIWFSYSSQDQTIIHCHYNALHVSENMSIILFVVADQSCLLHGSIIPANRFAYRFIPQVRIYHFLSVDRIHMRKKMIYR